MTDLIDRVAQKIDPGAFADPAPSAERARARLMAAPIIRLVLEEAARVADAEYRRASRPGDSSQPASSTAHRIAVAIRALAEPRP